MRGTTRVVGESTLAKNIDRMFSGERLVISANEPAPKFLTKRSSHSTCVEQIEYVQDVLSSTAFTNTPIAINAGVPVLFPQLAQIAALYELYCFEYLEFEYRPMVFDQLSSANNAMGVVGLAVLYDVGDQPLQNKNQASNFEGSMTAKPSDPIIYRVDCGRRRSKDNVLSEYYTRQGTYVTLQGILDRRMYDLATLNIFTSGQQVVGATLGEIWVKYKCCFYKSMPIQPTVPGVVLQAKYQNPGFNITSFGTDYFNAVNIVPKSGSTVNLVFGTNTITMASYLPIGQKFMLTLMWNIGSSATWTAPTITLGTGLNQINLLSSNTGSSNTFVFAQPSAFTVTFGMVITFQITGTPSLTGYTVFLTGGGNASSAANFDCVLTQLADQFTS